MEEPLDAKRMKMPEMPLPDALEDLIGELLQEAEEFEDEADDITSAWGDNLNQAGWGFPTDRSATSRPRVSPERSAEQQRGQWSFG
ncbi:MAG: hypothetical protein Ct9H300mP1_16710 [Planctomycetaceae bacterium]|nr:MAG: hypothetical protein Ct9H300mP1_16710 [Planctomycetaceae bacterium]